MAESPRESRLKIRTAWWYLVWSAGRALSDKAVIKHREIDPQLAEFGTSVAEVIGEIESR
jgi:hypothetical protein